jgi:hypothetical protein
MASPELDEIIALETAVWTALRDGDAAADARLLAHDFLGVYPTGFAGVDDHAGQLDSGATVASFRIDEPHLKVLTDDHVLLAYEATYQRPDCPEERMYVSSIWSRRDGDWINVFSQDTPPGPPVP